MRDRLERLAVEAERRAHPECVDRVGQDQDLDAAAGEAFQVRAGEDRVGILAERVVDRRLVRPQRGDVVGEAPPFLRRLAGLEAGDLVELVAPLGVLVEALLDDRAEGLPGLLEAFLVVRGELFQVAQDAVGDRLADRFEHRVLLQHLARDVERQVFRIDDAAHEAKPGRQDLGLVGDEDAADIELDAALALGIEEVERLPRRNEERGRSIRAAPRRGSGRSAPARHIAR